MFAMIAQFADRIIGGRRLTARELRILLEEQITFFPIQYIGKTALIIADTVMMRYSDGTEEGVKFETVEVNKLGGRGQLKASLREGVFNLHELNFHPVPSKDLAQYEEEVMKVLTFARRFVAQYQT